MIKDLKVGVPLYFNTWVFFAKMQSSKKRGANNWVTVTGKPRYKKVQVKVPQALVKDFTPLESAIHTVLKQASGPTTASEMVEIILKEMNCTKSDVGYVLYGRLKPYVEAVNWKERSRKWRIRRMKVKA